MILLVRDVRDRAGVRTGTIDNGRSDRIRRRRSDGTLREVLNARARPDMPTANTSTRPMIRGYGGSMT